MHEKIKSVCVFCGASNNVDPIFLEQGRLLGEMLAKKGLHMVFGAGDCGVMGATADGALKAGGTVTGVFPLVLDGMEKEHKHLTETLIVEDMHTRKKAMYDKSDAFVILPGGFGTMDETFEVITWKQLHTHNKPVVFYNFQNYWDHFKALTDQFIALGFASKNSRDLYDYADDLDEVFSCMFEQFAKELSAAG